MNSPDGAQGAAERQGMTLQEKQVFVLRALGEMAQHTFGFICSLIGVEDEKLGRHCGSALRCYLKGKRAVLTALHVIEEAMRAPAGIAISTGFGKPPYLIDGPISIDPTADLAAYFLPDDFPDCAFWPPARIDRTLEKLSTDYLFLHGFPQRRSYPSLLLGGVISKSLPYGAMQRLEYLPPHLEPFQFAVEYDPAGMVNENATPGDVVDPRGLSGSPVWRIGASGRPHSEWRPSDSLLVGIVTQWKPVEKVLIATSVQKLPPSW